MGIRADSSRNPSGFHPSRVCAHRAVPYPHQLPKGNYTANAVAVPLSLSQSITNNACGGRACQGATLHDRFIELPISNPNEGGSNVSPR